VGASINPSPGHQHTTAQILGWGLRGRCPRCGRGDLFQGYLTVAETCSACGLGFGGHDAGDGPAVFVIFILGFGVVGLAAIVEYLYSPPLWVHIVLWCPLIVGGGLLLLRPFKGLTIAVQYRTRAVDEPERPGAT
jgi:uncharacterized protein (DUF983 family)